MEGRRKLETRSTKRDRTTTWLLTIVWILIGWAALAAPSTAQQAPGDSLIAAAQAGDVAEVRRLLDGGADVDSRSKYGATALAFAVQRGNEPLASLLLARGADVDSKDRFYGFTPLTLAIMGGPDSEPHRRILQAIVERGPADVDPALLFGVQQADLDLIRASSGGATPKGMRAALLEAENRGVDRIVEEMRRLAPEAPEQEMLELTAEQLGLYAGDYGNEQLGMSIKIFLDSSGQEGSDERPELKLQVQGQPAFTLGAVAENEFVTTDLAGVEASFAGRAGTIERLVVTQAGQTLVFGRVDGSAMALTSDPPAGTAEPESAVSMPASVRGEPLPWPSFRGRNASGIADGQGVPATWNATTGSNLLWKSAVPGIALASPVIWGERVFVASAVSGEADASFRTGLYGDVDSIEDESSHRWIVQALDLRSGELIWQRTASEGPPKVKRHLKSSHANPTPVTDGEHLVVNFGSEGLFCYDLDGQLLWQRDLGVLNSGWFYDPTFEWGFASSPILYRDRVLVQVDIQQGSFLAAFDIAEGTELWRTPREEIPTWGTPTILESETGAEIITNGTTIRGYDPMSGKELWTLGPNSEVTVATPVVADGRAYVTANYPPVRPIYVLEPGGRGDLSLAEGESSNQSVVWSAKRGGVYIPSPIVYRGIYYALQMNGRLTAYDAATGEIIYRQRVGRADSFSSSAIAADGKLFFTTEQGTTYVVRAGREFELLAVNEVDEVVMSTAAASNGVVVIRGLHHLFGLATLPPTISTLSDKAFDPETATFAYSSRKSGNSDLWLQDGREGQSLNLTASPGQDHWVSWFPDGDRFAFQSRRDGQREIYLAAADGSGATNLTQHPADDLLPAVSPDGKRVLFFSDREIEHGPRELPGHLYVVDLESSEVRRITDEPLASTFGGNWSPDGRSVLLARSFDSDIDLVLLELDSGQERRLEGTTAAESSGSFSPDGNLIAFNMALESGESRIVVSRIDGSERRELTRGAQHYYPSWSPDGRWLMFTGAPLGAASFDLLLVPVEGGEVEPLVATEVDERSGAWKP